MMKDWSRSEVAKMFGVTTMTVGRKVKAGLLLTRTGDVEADKKRMSVHFLEPLLGRRVLPVTPNNVTQPVTVTPVTVTPVTVTPVTVTPVTVTPVTVTPVTVTPVINQDLMKLKGITSIEECQESGIFWFNVMETRPSNDSRGRQYLFIDTLFPTRVGPSIKLWGWDGIRNYPTLTKCVAYIKYEEQWGLSIPSMKLIRTVTSTDLPPRRLSHDELITSFYEYVEKLPIIPAKKANDYYLFSDWEFMVLSDPKIIVTVSQVKELVKEIKGSSPAIIDALPN